MLERRKNVKKEAVLKKIIEKNGFTYNENKSNAGAHRIYIRDSKKNNTIVTSKDMRVISSSPIMINDEGMSREDLYFAFEELGKVSSQSKKTLPPKRVGVKSLKVRRRQKQMQKKIG